MGLARPRKRVTRLGVLALLLMVGGLTPGAGSGAGAGAVQPVPPDDPGRGMVWRGLAPGRAENRCQGAYEVTGPAGQVLGCTHGPDPAPAGTDVRRARTTGDMAAAAAALPAPTAGPGTNGNGLPCIGDGVSGYRIEAIYAIAGPSSTRPDRYDQLAPLIRSSYAPYVEWQFLTSASENSAAAHVPFVTTPDASGCALVVRHEVLTAAGDDSFSNTISELKARGYNRTDRRYMVWMDANVLCGIGQIYRDNQPGQANANNGYYTAYGRSDAGCWGYSEGHELMHNLGGVQPEAPHGTAGFHCWDDNDEMCYDDDGAGPVGMQSLCSGRDGRLFDCNHDDYFHAGSPATGSWLSTHWNTYNSRFLVRTPLAPGGNLAPVVDAGPNRSVSLTQAASLDGTVTDDGLPAGAAVSATWAKSTGPGTVSFAGATSVDTTSSFSAAGTYTLSLTASDGQLTASDTMTVTVTDPNAPVTETFAGSFSGSRRTVTHTFSSGPGTINLTVSGPSNRTVTSAVYAPDGTLVGQVSGTGTRSFTVPGPTRGSYRLVMSGTNGSYNVTVRHPA
jgi:hypothetical protein